MKYKLHLIIGFTVLAFAFVSSYFAISVAEKIMMNSALRQIDSVAALQEVRLDSVLQRFDDELLLLKTRPNLLKQVSEHAKSRDDQSLELVRVMSELVMNAIPLVENIHVLFDDFSLMNSTNPAFTAEDLNGLELFKTDSLYLVDFVPFGDESARARFLVPINWGDELAAYYLVELNADQLISLTDTYDGLGATGETGIAMKLGDDEFMSLTRLRFKKSSLLTIGQISNKDGVSPIRFGLRGIEEFFVHDVTDYRSHHVVVGSRYLDKLGKRWSLAVKLDKDEVMADFYRFRMMIVFTIFGGLTALSLIAGLYLMISRGTEYRRA